MRSLDIDILLDVIFAVTSNQPLHPETCAAVEAIAREVDYYGDLEAVVDSLYRYDPIPTKETER